MPPSPPLCKFPMPRRRAAALPRINVFSIFLNLCPNNSHLFCIFVLVVGTGIWVYPSTCPYGYHLSPNKQHLIELTLHSPAALTQLSL